MKQMNRYGSLFSALAVLAFAAAPADAQTHVNINQPLFFENFSGYAVGTPPTTTANGGLWGTATHTGPGLFQVMQDTGDVFGQGTANQFLRLGSTRNLNPGLITPAFAVPQEVITFSFDFIGRYPAGDANRWLNVDARAGTAVAQLTSLRMSNHTIRTATGTTPANPSYGPNDEPVRIVTVVNNRADTISYDKPDGSGTANLSSAMSALWLYHYSTATWENVFPEYTFTRTLTSTGALMDNIRFFLDSNTELRSFDVDNIAVFGSIPVPEPSAAALVGLSLPALVWFVRRRRS